MFYFLIFHTSISKSNTIDKKLLTTFLYGSVLYLILHGLIKTSEYSIFKYIANYFWYIIAIDIATLIYLTKDIVDYQKFFSRIIDTSIYENDIPTINTFETMTSHSPLSSIQLPETTISSQQKLNQTQKSIMKNVNFNEEANNNQEYDTSTPPNTVSKINNYATTGNDISSYDLSETDKLVESGLEHSTSINDLLSSTDNINDKHNIETINIPENMNEFFSETIDVTDGTSNISDINEIDLSDFENNLN